MSVASKQTSPQSVAEPTSTSTPPRLVPALVAGSCRQWEAMVGPVDCRPSNRRFEALLAAVHA